MGNPPTASSYPKAAAPSVHGRTAPSTIIASPGSPARTKKPVRRSARACGTGTTWLKPAYARRPASPGDEERPHAGQRGRDRERRLVQHDRRRREQLGHRPDGVGGARLERRQRPVGVREPRETVGHALHALPAPHRHVVVVGAERAERDEILGEHERLPDRRAALVPAVLADLLAELRPQRGRAELVQPRASMPSKKRPARKSAFARR
jgi:hypothetical protein